MRPVPINIEQPKLNMMETEILPYDKRSENKKYNAVPMR